MLRTDHSSLQWLYTFKEPEGQIARWLEKLQEFDFGVVLRSGRNHGNAAALSSSRLPLEQDVNVNTLLGLVVSERSMQQLQLQDKSIGPVYQAMQDGSKPGPETIQAGSRELLQLIGQWDQLTLKDGVLYRQHENANGHMKFQVILPEVSRKGVLDSLHNKGEHLGETKTLSRVQERFYWPGYVDAVKLWCRNCPYCAARKKPMSGAHCSRYCGSFSTSAKLKHLYHGGVRLFYPMG